LSWWGYSGSERRSSVEEEILRDSVDRNGCEGALIACQQVEPERDCYRRIEEECRRLQASRREGEEGSRDSEPGPPMY